VLSGEEVILKYYFLGSRRVAMRRDGVVYYFHTDHLGSTSAMSDGQGAAHGDPVRYLPFGEVRSGDLGALPTDHGFTGHKHEAAELGLIFMQARFFVLGLGRFLSADILVPNPADPQSYNRYAYVLNNPLRLVDPSGCCGRDGRGARWDDATYDQVAYDECVALRDGLELEYGLEIEGTWYLSHMRLLAEALGLLAGGDGFGTAAAFRAAMGTGSQEIIVRYFWAAREGANASYSHPDGIVSLFAGTWIRSDPEALGTIIHEFAHAWDFRSGNSLSEGLMEATGSQYGFQKMRDGDMHRTYWEAGMPVYQGLAGFGVANHLEDWAETVAYSLVTDSERFDRFHERYQEDPSVDGGRLGYVESHFLGYQQWWQLQRVK
jgi:RHS repeat-associated protein